MYSSEARGALKRRPPLSPHPTFAQVCPLDNTHVNHVNFQLPLHYILLKFWGGGSYGTVVRARDMRTNMKCAIIKRWAAWRVPPHRGRQALAARAQAAQAPRPAHQHRAHGGYLPWVGRERRTVEHVHHRIIFFPFQFTGARAVLALSHAIVLGEDSFCAGHSTAPPARKPQNTSHVRAPACRGARREALAGSRRDVRRGASREVPRESLSPVACW